MTTPAKTQYPRAEAVAVAREIVHALEPHCDKIIVAGSLRRRKLAVGDVEILYVPKLTTEKADLFSERQVSLADRAIDGLLAMGVLAKRPNTKGHFSWGDKNKLALHVASGIPVDLFAATAENWWNYLVCRTGSHMHNIRICEAARAKGLMWHPYDSGFTNVRGDVLPVNSEEEVFTIAGLPYLKPEHRGRPPWPGEMKP